MVLVIAKRIATPLMNVSNRSSGLDMELYSAEDIEELDGILHQRSLAGKMDSQDPITRGWQMVEDPMQASVRLEGIGIYAYVSANEDEGKVKVGSKHRIKERKPTFNASQRDSSIDIIRKERWGWVPEDPDWEIIDALQQQEAQSETKSDGEDWVVCEMNKHGKVEMFEGVRAEEDGWEDQATAPPLESYETVLAHGGEFPAIISSKLATDEDYYRLRLHTASPAPKLRPPQPSERSHSKLVHEDSLPARQEKHSDTRVPRASKARMRTRNPSTHRPLSSEEQDLPFRLHPADHQHNLAPTHTEEQDPSSPPPRMRLPAPISTAYSDRTWKSHRPRHPHSGIMRHVLNAAESEGCEHVETYAEHTRSHATDSKDMRGRERENRTERYPGHWYGPAFGPGYMFAD